MTISFFAVFTVAITAILTLMFIFAALSFIGDGLSKGYGGDFVAGTMILFCAAIFGCIVFAIPVYSQITVSPITVKLVERGLEITHDGKVVDIITDYKSATTLKTATHAEVNQDFNFKKSLISTKYYPIKPE